MSEIWQGIVEAARLLADGDAEVARIAVRTVLISLVATALAMLAGVPLGYLLARRRFAGRTIVLGIVNTGMGMPPVLAGLVVWLMLVRSGPFGGFELIYTPEAIVVAQFLIATPLVVGFSTASVQALPPQLPELLTMLGAGPARRIWLLAREAKLGLLAAIIAGFGAIISEVGAAMTVGGNLRDSTRVLTTAIVTETSRGRTEQALALGFILLILAFTVSLVLTFAQQRKRG